MLLPFLTEDQSPSKKYTISFKGLNYGEGTQDGEFADTHNLSTDEYPCITQRAERVNVKQYNKPYSIHAKGQLLVIDEILDDEGKETGKANVYYGDSTEPIGTVTSGKKQTATVGNYIIIFPDKKYYKVPTKDEDGVMQEGEFGDMEVEFPARGLKFTSSEIKSDGYKERWVSFTSSTISLESVYTKDSKSNTEGEARVYPNRITMTRLNNLPFVAGDEVTISKTYNGTLNGTKAVIIAATTNTLTFADGTLPTKSSASYDSYDSITITKTIKIPFYFKAGEKIKISGCSKTDNNKEVTIKKVSDYKLTFADGTFAEATETGEITIAYTELGEFPFKKGDSIVIKGCSTSENNKDEEIIIRGVTSDTLTFDNDSFTATTESGVVTISRTVPDLDFICENNFRLWGVSADKNTIYSSKWSDPTNFKSFDGLAEDSYAIEVGSEGEFTGCIPYSSHICFFKENTLHKLYGTKPSNFQVTTSNVYGVQSGSDKSMQIINEELLYKGVGGIYAYTGGVPELISEKFGTKRYAEAVACSDGEKYYISMRQGDKWSMFSYDVAKRIWLREDDTQAVDMTFYDGKVHFLDARGGLYYIDKTADRSKIEWGATFCTIHETMNERKVYSKFHLRLDLSAGAWLAVDIKTDNDTQWRQVYSTHNAKAKTITVPIMPTRCDSIDIRLRGKGKCTIKAFIREFATGSDV